MTLLVDTLCILLSTALSNISRCSPSTLPAWSEGEEKKGRDKGKIKEEGGGEGGEEGGEEGREEGGEEGRERGGRWGERNGREE